MHDVDDSALRVKRLEPGVDDHVDIVGQESGGDHGGEHLCRLGGFPFYADADIMQTEACGRLRHGGGDEAERFAEKLAGDVELGPRIECRAAGQRGINADLHEAAGVAVGAPDVVVDMCFP